MHMFIMATSDFTFMCFAGVNGYYMIDMRDNGMESSLAMEILTFTITMWLLWAFFTIACQNMKW